MQRQKITERPTFDYDDKVEIAQKSNERCCMCGKKVYFGYGATIDHFVPLNKGGINQDLNLVMLCDECNHNKADKVINPTDFLPYLKEKSKKKLEMYFDDYIKSFEYIKRDNILACDEYKIEVYPMLKGRYYNKNRKMPTETLILSRATFEDKNELVEYYESYLRKYSLDYKTAKARIDFYLRFGCIYCLKKDGKIKMFCAITIRALDFLSRYKDIQKAIQVFPVCKYSNDKNAFLIVSMYDYLIQRLMWEQGLNHMTSIITIHKNDSLSFKSITARTTNIYEDYLGYISGYHVHSTAGSKKVTDTEAKNLNEFYETFEEVYDKAKAYIEKVNAPSWMKDLIQDSSYEEPKNVAFPF